MKSLKFYINFHRKNLLTLGLIIIFLWSLTYVDWNDELIHSGGKVTIIQIVKAFFQPDLTPRILNLAVVSTWRTLAYAITGMTSALFVASILGVLASGVLVSNPFRRKLSMTVFRGILGFMRSIHELVWALLFVASIGLSPFAGIFALAIPYGGTLGRIFADILRDVPKEPIGLLESSGASRLQILFYGYLPMAIPDMISYAMYRLECAVRSSAIMSFVGLGGLGYQIHLSLSDLEYNEVWTFMFFLIGLVLIIDLWSNSLRKRLV